MQVDVVTLFPEWFEWFQGQRHVGNAVARGSELRFLNPREHTPLSGGQVDDTPFGGGAGMVLRVDVMDAALRAFYGVDPLDLRTQRRVIALTPGGRMLDEEGHFAFYGDAATRSLVFVFALFRVRTFSVDT